MELKADMAVHLKELVGKYVADHFVRPYVCQRACLDYER